MKIRLLKSATMEELRDAVPDNLDLYRSGSFSNLAIDDALWFELDVEINEEKLSEIGLPKGPDLYEVDNCITLYEAFKNLSPYEARDERLWAYYVHTSLLEYSRKRWPIPSNDEDAIKQIRSHFFARDKRQVERDNAASRLWWMAHLCARVPEIDLATALEAFLYKSDVRANLIERPTTSQSTELFGAILAKLITSYRGKRILFDRKHFRPLMAELNSVGGYKLIDCFNSSQADNLVDRVISNKLQLADI